MLKFFKVWYDHCLKSQEEFREMGYWQFYTPLGAWVHIDREVYNQWLEKQKEIQNDNT